MGIRVFCLGQVRFGRFNGQAGRFENQQNTQRGQQNVEGVWSPILHELSFFCSIEERDSPEKATKSEEEIGLLDLGGRIRFHLVVGSTHLYRHMIVKRNQYELKKLLGG